MDSRTGEIKIEYVLHTRRKVNVEEDMECQRRHTQTHTHTHTHTHLQTSSTNTEKVNEKLFNMEHGQKKNASLHGFLYISR
jgi:hypothetical protein